MVRGSGKFKQKRGGGRNFSKDMAFDRGTEAGKARTTEGDLEESSEEDDSEESEEESSEEDSSSDAGPAGALKPAQPELTRQQRRELKKKQGGKEKAKAAAAAAKASGKNAGGDEEGSSEEESEEEDEEGDEELVNSNHVQKKMTISDLGKPRELTRREREQKEKQDAKERYWKLHQQGKTEEAKNDLSRLAKIRAEREAAQAKRKAENEAREQEAEAKKQAQIKAGRK